MAKLFNLARMSTTTTGTGTITLGSAVSGFLSFSGAGVSDGDVISYGIKDGTNSEVGTGTYTASGTTLTRTVTKSTNSNTAISLSGSAEVFITPRAEDLTPAGLGALAAASNLSDLASAATALTNLGGTTVGKAVFTAASAAAARSTLGSTTVGDAVFVAADAATARSALGAPAAPTGTASAVGEWKVINVGANTAVTLPSGGTWAWAIQTHNSAGGGLSSFSPGACGVSAGGTTIAAAPGASTFWNGFCWRIA